MVDFETYLSFRATMFETLRKKNPKKEKTCAVGYFSNSNLDK